MYIFYSLFYIIFVIFVRLAIEGMVEDLINADADINAADNSGKTALHWAAAVNNVDAVNVLLMHGANRDAQDDKVRDPRIDKGVKVALIFSVFFSCIILSAGTVCFQSGI